MQTAGELKVIKWEHGLLLFTLSQTGETVQKIQHRHLVPFDITGQQKNTFVKMHSKFLYKLQGSDVLNTMLPSVLSLN